MSTLTTLRTDIAAALEAAGIHAIEHVAEVMQPPVAVVVPDDPYITTSGENLPYGHVVVRMSVLLISDKATNKAAASKIDSMIEQAYMALNDDWDITEVTTPGQVTVNGSTFLGSVISITQETKLSGGTS